MSNQTQIAAGVSTTGTFRSEIVGHVKVRQSWTDSWQQVPYLIPIKSEDSSISGQNKATLLWQYGSRQQHDSTSFSTETPQDLAGYFCKITLLYSGGQERDAWFGVIDDDQFRMTGNIAPRTGSQVLTAYGLDHMLDRNPIISAYVLDNAVEKQIGHVPLFNERQRRGAALLGNRSTARGDGGNGSFLFGDTNEWSNLDVVEYLLERHVLGELTFKVKGQTELLSSIKAVNRLEGLTIRQALDHLIDRKRGIGWTIRVTGSIAEVFVFSAFGDDVSIGADTISGNPDKINLVISGRKDIDDVVLNLTNSPRYDAISATGQRIKSACTLSVFNGTLERAWTDAEEDAYLAEDVAAPSDKSKSDLARKADKHERVFQTFRAPENWDWQTADFLTGELLNEFVNPFALPDGTIDTTTQQVFWNDNRPFLRFLPFQKPAAISGADAEFERPLAIFFDPAQNQYVQADAMDIAPGAASSELDSRKSCHVRVLDREMGIFIKAEINHILGLGHFGTQLTTNPGFDSDASSWSIGSLTWVSGSIETGIAALSVAQVVEPNPAITVVAGNTYSVAFQVKERIGPPSGGEVVLGSVTPQIGATIGTASASGADGWFLQEIVATDTTNLKLTAEIGFRGAIDNIFVVEAPLPSNIKPQINYESLLITVFVETDMPVHAIQNDLDFSQIANPRILEIKVEDAEMWYVTPRTVTGVTSGSLVTHAGGLVRDDSPRLRAIGALAWGWYSKARASLEATFKDLAAHGEVGNYIVDAGDAVNKRDVGTVITKVSRNYERQTTVIQSDDNGINPAMAFADFPGLSGPRAVSREIRRMREDITELKGRTGNIVDRVGNSAGLGSILDDLNSGLEELHGHTGPTDKGWIAVFFG